MPDTIFNQPIERNNLELTPSNTIKTQTSYNRLSSDEQVLDETLIEKIKRRIANKEFWFSLEFFPPRTANGAANLISKLEILGAGNPLFCDITWHPAGDPANLEKMTSSMKIASVMRNYCLLETMLHITCVNMDKETMKDYLDRAKSQGIRNLLALRGDPPSGVDWNPQAEFNFATDMVKFIKEHYDDYFVICVAGYPNGHPDAPSYQEDLMHLKEKCDAGADFIITQLFFKAETFVRFFNDCRRIGIEVPIIPGILVIQSYDSLRHICKLSKLEVPQHIVDALENMKDDDEAIRKYGIEKSVELCRDLIDSGVVHGLHFYTMNREVAITGVLRSLDLWEKKNGQPALPWQQSPHARKQEEVRPIFWSTRPKSYVCQTSAWDQFPNGRWGLSSAPSFGDLKDYHIFYQKIDKKKLLAELGDEVPNEQAVWEIFELFISGEPNKKGNIIKSFPWSENELSPETNSLKEQLCRLNKKGILTINSQPNVNGEPSNNEISGWGSPDGYVYQKAYLEFFMQRDNLLYLIKAIDNLEKKTRVNYQIIDKTGEINITNCDPEQPNAVTWGVFPGKEIIQPTVVDPMSFLSWKDEAFNLWHQRWGVLYEPDSVSKKTLDHIENTYVLVNLVDNDFPRETCLWSVIEQMFELKENDKRDENAHLLGK